MKYIPAFVALLMLSGCAVRFLESDNKDRSGFESMVTTLSNSYSRNYIVAAPTLVGNLVCGAPFYPIGLALADKALDQAFSPGVQWAVYGSGVSIFAGLICGTVTGTLFIPFSFLCHENPWYNFPNNDDFYWEVSCVPPKRNSPFYKIEK